jgi:sugar lactone lactonase YvrE
MATSDNDFIFIPDSSLPFPPTHSYQSFRKVETKTIISHGPDEKRFNDAAVDPVGRFLAGTMGKMHHQRVGKLYALGSGGQYQTVLEGVSCSNGIGWSPDGRLMYIILSAALNQADS